MSVETWVLLAVATGLLLGVGLNLLWHGRLGAELRRGRQLARWRRLYETRRAGQVQHGVEWNGSPRWTCGPSPAGPQETGLCLLELGHDAEVPPEQRVHEGRILRPDRTVLEGQTWRQYTGDSETSR